MKSPRRLTQMQERAIDVVRSYCRDEEAEAAAARLMVSRTPMPKEALHEDIWTRRRRTPTSIIGSGITSPG